jgi:hypothetical protein
MAENRRKKRSLVLEGEQSQKMPKGLDIPIPMREEVLRNLEKVAKAPSRTKGRPKQ